MLKIAIIDDEQHARTDLEKKIRECAEQIDETCEIECFFSGIEFLEAKKKFELVFLDVQMPQKDGIETGVEIRKWDKECAIVIATGTDDRFQEVFLFHTFRYIMKPFIKSEITETLQTYVKERCNTDYISVFDNRYSLELPISKVRYIQAYDGYCRIVAGEKIYRSEMPLKDYEEQLDKERFFRINRTYLVHLKYMTNLPDSNTVVLGEKTVKIPKSRRHEWYVARMKYDAKHGGEGNV